MIADIIYLNGIIAARRTIWLCPVCEEPINYFAEGEGVGHCSGDCGYNTAQERD